MPPDGLSIEFNIESGIVNKVPVGELLIVNAADFEQQMIMVGGAKDGIVVEFPPAVNDRKSRFNDSFKLGSSGTIDDRIMGALSLIVPPDCPPPNKPIEFFVPIWE